MESDKNHWENIYRTKGSADLSWTQALPSTSLGFIHSFHLPKTARIIDIGGGDSQLVDCLLDEGYTSLTVLDISGAALQKAKQRLGDRAHHVQWIEQDITRFNPAATYDLWHDRATFHFLTTETQIATYLTIARSSVKTNCYTLIGTFSDQGPEKCSGLPIRQYSEEALTHQLTGFQKIKCITEDHITPFDTRQNFTFCSFRKVPAVA
jgi:SAM-dependent methyltransferase